MGELNVHDLSAHIYDFGCNVFVETGTCQGTGVEHAMQFDFNHMYSIEIMKELFDECVTKFDGVKNLTLILDDSLAGLATVLEQVDESDSILFWLDAHFPGADVHMNSYDHMSEFPDLHCPLKRELELIADSRPDGLDVIIIDDLQLYEEGPYELAYPEGFANKYGSMLNLDAFKATHKETRVYRHQGSMVLTPCFE